MGAEQKFLRPIRAECTHNKASWSWPGCSQSVASWASGWCLSLLWLASTSCVPVTSVTMCPPRPSWPGAWRPGPRWHQEPDIIIIIGRGWGAPRRGAVTRSYSVHMWRSDLIVRWNDIKISCPICRITINQSLLKSCAVAVVLFLLALSEQSSKLDGYALN